jgi:hypothetical protein
MPTKEPNKGEISTIVDISENNIPEEIADKREVYNQKYFPLINDYIRAFTFTSDNIGSCVYDICRYNLYLTKQKIIHTFNISESDVVKFAFNYHYKTYVLNGIMISSSIDHLYFIESDNYIKIGRTKNTKKRISQIQISIPEKLKYNTIIYNKGCYEFDLHYIFNYLNVSGEWFYKHNDIYEYIDLLLSKNNNIKQDVGIFLNYEKSQIEWINPKNIRSFFPNDNIIYELGQYAISLKDNNMSKNVRKR